MVRDAAPEIDPVVLSAACRLGLPYLTVHEAIGLDPGVLKARAHDSLLSGLDGRPPVPVELPFGSAGLYGFGGDVMNHDVVMLKQFNPHALATAEQTQDILRHESFGRYCRMFEAGVQPPPVMVFESANQAVVSANRRRVLAAQETNRPLVGWLVPNHDGIGLKLGDVLAVVEEERERVLLEQHGQEPSSVVPNASRDIMESDLTPAEVQSGRVSIPQKIQTRSGWRPTRNSEGWLIAQTGDALRNFWGWFKGSRAVDGFGRPNVLYHGTIVRPSRQEGVSLGDISSFDRRSTLTLVGRTPSLDAAGVWLSSNPVGAGMYASGAGAAIYPVYVRVTGGLLPFDTFDDFLQDWGDAHKEMGPPDDLLDNHRRRPFLGDPDGYNSHKRRQGVGALVIRPHATEASTEFECQSALVVLDECDIASATASTWRQDQDWSMKSAMIQKGGQSPDWRSPPPAEGEEPMECPRPG